jgi:hypothetical protein
MSDGSLVAGVVARKRVIRKFDAEWRLRDGDGEYESDGCDRGKESDYRGRPRSLASRYQCSTSA